jgi:predicted ATPase
MTSRGGQFLVSSGGQFFTSPTARFGQDARATTLGYRSLALWPLGYPHAARADVEEAVKHARDIGQAGALMHSLWHASLIQILCGNYAAANAFADELVGLADEKGALFWKAWGNLNQGGVLALLGKANASAQLISRAVAAFRSTKATLFLPLYLSLLTKSYTGIGQFDEAWRSIGEAIAMIEATKERWHEAEVNRIAGEILLMEPEPDAAKTQNHFERALSAARQQQAKSWELRAAVSLARLWRDRGNVQQARELLAPVYGWFTEGFDTRDLKDAKRC